MSYLSIVAYRFFRSNIIFKKPCKMNDAGVSPGCTRDDMKII